MLGPLHFSHFFGTTTFLHLYFQLPWRSLTQFKRRRRSHSLLIDLGLIRRFQIVLCKSKVTDINFILCSLSVSDEKILRLNVSVYDALAMDLFQYGDNLNTNIQNGANIKLSIAHFKDFAKIAS
jgi:hypothetical protein